MLPKQRSGPIIILCLSLPYCGGNESTGIAKTTYVLTSGEDGTRCFLLDEPEIRIKVVDWIHKNCDKDGEPGITVTSFKHYINGEVYTQPTRVVYGNCSQSCSAGNCKKMFALLGDKVPEINGKTGFADGHERPNVKAQRRHLVNVMSELGKESFLHLSPMTVERAAMWGIPQMVIEERIMEVREGEAGKNSA